MVINDMTINNNIINTNIDEDKYIENDKLILKGETFLILTSFSGCALP